MTDQADQGGEAPCWAHIVDDLDRPPTELTVLTSNSIIYCRQWSDVVAFYRDGLGLRPTMERDWFVEFELHAGSHISVADAGRATVGAGDGSGLTLSWRIDNIAAVRTRLAANGVEMSDVLTRWEARCFFVLDPAGNRIEFWAQTRDAQSPVDHP